MKAEDPRLNVSEVRVALGKGGNNSFGKRGSSGISNLSNAAVDDRLFEKHEYNALNPEQKIHCASSESSVAMLEMVMAEVVLEMKMAMENAPPSSHCTALLRC
jgi:hypothetical protein